MTMKSSRSRTSENTWHRIVSFQTQNMYMAVVPVRCADPGSLGGPPLQLQLLHFEVELAAIPGQHIATLSLVIDIRPL